MTNFDVIYMNLVNEILKKGFDAGNSNGIELKKIPLYTFELDLAYEFPILECVDIDYEIAITLMLWMWQEQSNDVRYLHERNVHVLDELMIDSDGIYRIYEPIGSGEYDSNKEVVVFDPLSVPVSALFGEVKKMKPKYDENGCKMYAKSLIPGRNIKAAKYFGKEYAYTIGTACGFYTSRCNMIDNILKVIKSNSNVDGISNNLFQKEFLRTATFLSSVHGVEFDVTSGKLNLFLYLKDCDVASELAFYVVQYATLLKMVAQVTNLEVGTISCFIEEPCIHMDYVDVIKGQYERWKRYKELQKWKVRELLGRADYIKYWKNNAKNVRLSEKILNDIEIELNMIDMILNPHKPDLWLNSDISDFFNFDNSQELKDIKIRKYRPVSRINSNADKWDNFSEEY